MNHLLTEYAAEIHCHSLTLEELIHSHRTLRNLRLDVEVERRNYLKEGYDLGLKQGISKANSPYIFLSELKEMTLSEIVTLIGEDKNE